MERDQLESLVHATGCAEKHGDFTFLVDPNWSPTQRTKFDELKKSKIENPKSKIQRGWLCIPTGGSSGGLKFARHDEQTLRAAVDGFCGHFGLAKVDAIDVLPPWHVSGLMARVRCAATRGKHVAWDWKQLESGEFPEITGTEIISLVPTQLQRLLADTQVVMWLRKLKLILIGGGPVWPSLADEILAVRLPVVFSYGMTETAAMIAAQTPGEFATGDRSSGRTMRHAQVEICDEETGGITDAEKGGLIQVSGDSVMWGYYGEERSEGSFLTADWGRIDRTGHLHIEGRRDDMIITGGEKVSARAIEAILRDFEMLADVVVIGLPHTEWGEEVVACYMSDDPESDATLVRWASAHLQKHQCPKRFLRFNSAAWPRNYQGKINRAELRRLALSHPSG